MDSFIHSAASPKHTARDSHFCILRDQNTREYNMAAFSLHTYTSESISDTTTQRNVTRCLSLLSATPA